MCPSQGTLARIVKDAVVGIEVSESLDIALTDELNLTPSQQFVRVHACHPFPIDTVILRLPRPA
jgi:hypothetical protein